MSPFRVPVILDNNCISNFHSTTSLGLILNLWSPGTFKIPQRVYNEASDWPEHGKEVCDIIERLARKNIVEIISINDDSEAEVNNYIQLRLAAPVLGQGESESIAIAQSRGYAVATDDRLATERCKCLFPSVQVVTTGDILKMAKSDGLLDESEVNRMWKLIRSKDSRRRRHRT